LALAVAGVACASSAGGGANGEGGTGIDTSGGAYSISPTSLTFQARAGGPRPDAQSVQVTANGISLFVKTEISGAAVESAMVEVTGDQTATVVVQPASPVAVPDGMSTASVRIVGCKDPVCSGEVEGSPKTVAITYTKTAGGLTGSPSAMTFTQTPGADPAPQTVSLSDLGSGSPAWSSSVSYGNDTGWLAVTPSSGNGLPATASVSIVPAKATRSGTASIQFMEGTTSVFDVAVTFVALGATFQVMPMTLNVVGAFGSATPDQHLSLSDGSGASYPWMIQVEYQPLDVSGWLSVSSMTGASLPADVVVSLGAVPDRLTHTATLRITGSTKEFLVPISYRTP
jgi:hypothetical protein